MLETSDMGTFWGNAHPGISRSRVARSGRSRYRQTRTRAGYKTVFRSKFLSFTTKILFPKNTIFQKFKKQHFRASDARVKRARLADNLLICAMTHYMIVQNFSPIGPAKLLKFDLK